MISIVCTFFSFFVFVQRELLLRATTATCEHSGTFKLCDKDFRDVDPEMTRSSSAETTAVHSSGAAAASSNTAVQNHVVEYRLEYELYCNSVRLDQELPTPLIRPNLPLNVPYDQGTYGYNPVPSGIVKHLRSKRQPVTFRDQGVHFPARYVVQVHHFAYNDRSNYHGCGYHNRNAGCNWDLQGQQEGENTWINIAEIRDDNATTKGNSSRGFKCWDVRESAGSKWFTALRIVKNQGRVQSHNSYHYSNPQVKLGRLEFYGRIYQGRSRSITHQLHIHIVNTHSLTHSLTFKYSLTR